MISVVCPTVTGREGYLRDCEAAYARTTEDYEFIAVKDPGPCGVGWNIGAEKATGDYIHFTADDLNPHDGWWEAAKEVIDRGQVPSPVVYWPDGRVQSCGGSWEALEEDGAVTEFTRVPILSREMWDAVKPMLPIHYFTDNYVSFKTTKAGWPTVVCLACGFTHHMAQEGRVNTMGEDCEAYALAVAACQ